MSDDKFCLKWNDFESNISRSFKELREEKDLFDVWLSCDNGQMELPAHKLILSACSSVLKHLLRRKSGSGGCSSHVLYLRGVQSQDLEYILSFMYNGEVSLAQDQLNSFLAVAEDLQIKGLTQNSSEKSNSKPSGSNLNQRQSHHRRTNQSNFNQRSNSHSHPPPPVTQEADDDIEEVESIKCEPNSNYENSNQLLAQDDQTYEVSDQMYQEDTAYQDPSCDMIQDLNNAGMTATKLDLFFTCLVFRL